MTQLWSAISVESRDFIMNGRDLWWKVDERLRYVMTGQDFIMNGRDILWQVEVLLWAVESLLRTIEIFIMIGRLKSVGKRTPKCNKDNKEWWWRWTKWIDKQYLDELVKRRCCTKWIDGCETELEGL